MLLVRTSVAPSTIHGIGLFAVDPIPAGTVWWRFDLAVDRTIPAKLLPLMSQTFRDHVERYGFLSDGFWTLCGDNAIFVNHSDNPPSLHEENVSIAYRGIACGEEITEDYGHFHCLGISLSATVLGGGK